MNPGIYDTSAVAYHSDDIFGDQADPTFSASIANTLLTSSPRHAWTKHPRLNPNYQPVDDDKFNVGTIVHALLLEGISVMEVCQFDSWRSNDAKDAKALARSHGRVPVLVHQAQAVTEMVDAVAAQLERLDLDPLPLTDGKPEQTMVWEEAGVLCRARIDWLHSNWDVVDVKTTSRLAVGWDRGPLFDHGCDLQAAFYLRGLQTLHPEFLHHMHNWTWLVIETSPPYGLIPYRLTAPVLAIGDAKVDRALAIWRDCLERDEWPLYEARAVDAELPPWIESRWLAREAEWAA